MPAAVRSLLKIQFSSDHSQARKEPVKKNDEMHSLQEHMAGLSLQSQASRESQLAQSTPALKGRAREIYIRDPESDDDSNDNEILSLLEQAEERRLEAQASRAARAARPKPSARGRGRGKPRLLPSVPLPQQQHAASAQLPLLPTRLVRSQAMEPVASQPAEEQKVDEAEEAELAVDLAVFYEGQSQSSQATEQASEQESASDFIV